MRGLAQLLQMLTMRQEHKHTDTHMHTYKRTLSCTCSRVYSPQFNASSFAPAHVRSLTPQSELLPLSAALRVAATLCLLLLLLCFGLLLFGHLLHFLCPMRFAFQLISYAQSERVRKRFLHCYCLFFVKQSLLFA